MAELQVRRRAVQLYLFAYNLMMFLVYFFLFVDLAIEHKKGTYTYMNHFPTLRIGTALQLMDVAHAALGLTKTSLVNGLVQVLGRLFMLHIVVGVDYQHDHLPVSVMLFAYMLIELVRYPYYMLRALDKEWYPFTWMRYNAWLVLYPTGLTMEFLCLLRCFGYHYHYGTYGHWFPVWITSRKWIVAGFCSIFIGMVFPFMAFNLLLYMYKQRQQKFGGRLFTFNSSSLYRKFKQVFRLDNFLNKNKKKDN